MMNAGTTVGASSPVASGGQDIDSTMAQKVMNDTRALMRTIAQNRGRNIETAERFVTDAESITAEEALASQVRSEERRVGKEGRSRETPVQEKEQKRVGTE